MSTAASEPSASRRWRTFADVVALTLGINVWVSVDVLPAAFAGGARSLAQLVAAALPLAALLLGIARRSEGMLLGAFPAAVLVPVGLTPQLASMHVYGAWRFALVALGLVAYLLGVSFFTTFHEPPPPRSVRALSSAAAGPPARWRRRERVYWTLTALAVAMPAALLYWVNFDRRIQEYLAALYPGRVALMTTALDVGAIVLWLAIYHHAFLGVLRPHRTGDRDLVVALAQARADARAGRPRRQFYLGVALALGAMVALALFRHA